jgi:spermidine synthase
MPEQSGSPPGNGAHDGDIAPGVMTEYLSDGWGFFVRSARQIEKFKSPYQAVEVHESAQFGKLFRLDGHFMTSEQDEFFYHENLVHMSALTHPSPERALIIGGGDGGSAEELLKHPSIKSVTLCELDLAVVDVARKYLRSVHKGALDDRRLELRIGDGFEYIRESDEQYDLIVLDLTDPVGPAEALYTPDFYRACAVRLKPVGAMTLHVASPVAHPERIRACVANLRKAFPVVAPYLTSVPLYGGMWMMACVSQSLDPRSLSGREIDRRISQRALPELRWYNGEMHRAALSLPNFVRDLVA